MKNKALFLDRDGVINRMIRIDGQWDSPRNADEFKFRRGIIDFMKSAQESGYLLFVVTNQPGVAKRKVKPENLDEIHKKLISECMQRGVKIEKIYTCLHHPDAIEPSLRRICNCRKPKPGMILDALSEFRIDPKKSYMIGDRSVDIQTGRKAGCKTILLCWAAHDYRMALQEEQFRPDIACTSVNSLKKYFTKVLLL